MRSWLSSAQPTHVCHTRREIHSIQSSQGFYDYTKVHAPRQELLEKYGLKYGTPGELVIILSCPADKHPWDYAEAAKQVDAQGRYTGPHGNVYSTFQAIAEESQGTIIHCPVQFTDKEDPRTTHETYWKA